MQLGSASYGRLTARFSYGLFIIKKLSVDYLQNSYLMLLEFEAPVQALLTSKCAYFKSCWENAVVSFNHVSSSPLRF